MQHSFVTLLIGKSQLVKVMYANTHFVTLLIVHSQLVK